MTLLVILTASGSVSPSKQLKQRSRYHIERLLQSRNKVNEKYRNYGKVPQVAKAQNNAATQGNKDQSKTVTQGNKEQINALVLKLMKGANSNAVTQEIKISTDPKHQNFRVKPIRNGRLEKTKPPKNDSTTHQREFGKSEKDELEAFRKRRPGKTGGAGGPWPPHFFAKQS